MPKNPIAAALIFLYACATLQLVRFYVKSASFYLNMSAYLSGHERLPFQERILPALIIGPINRSRWIMRHLIHPGGVFTPEKGIFYLLSLVALVVAGIYTQKLYTAVSTTRLLPFLVYPTFLFAVMWTYVIHSEANFSYPYDFLSLAFFTAGLYYIYARNYLALLLVILIGTLNRETTLFLIGIYVLDAASTTTATFSSVRDRFNLRQVSWPRLALLCVAWLAVKLTVHHIFRHNDASENYVRIGENVGRLKIRLVPALLNICGYTLPIVVLMRRWITSSRFANYLLILPVWFAVMFYTGVIVETRIYGELCSFSAVALVLILEARTQSLVAASAARVSGPATA